MQDVSTELGKIAIYGAQDEFTVPISVAASEAYDWTDAASQGKIVGVNTGFTDLDNLLGSLYPDNLYIVAGRPGMGKTAFLLSVARHAARDLNKRIAIFSLEMSRAPVAQRLIAQEGEVDLFRILKGRLEDQEWPRYTHAVEAVAAWPIVINDMSSININQIRQTARKIKASGGLDLLIVDYIQLAESGERNRERRELDVSAVSRGLKHLARELNVPILAAAQLSRAVEQRAGNRAILSDLRESGSLEQEAYAVIFISKTDQFNVMDLDVAKHRNGPVGSCELIFSGSYARFDNAATKYLNPRKDID
jgi:replicative DNA helicase